jgi:hypothetical protein
MANPETSNQQTHGNGYIEFVRFERQRTSSINPVKGVPSETEVMGQ